MVSVLLGQIFLMLGYSVRLGGSQSVETENRSHPSGNKLGREGVLLFAKPLAIYMYLNSCFHRLGPLESLYSVAQTRQTHNSQEVGSHKCVIVESWQSQAPSGSACQKNLSWKPRGGVLKVCHAGSYEV